MQGKKAVIILIVVIIALGAGWFLYRYFSPELNKEIDVPSILSDNKNMTLQLTSSAFENEGFIPAKYTCDQAPPSGSYGFNPPLKISGVPEGTKSLVLVMDDPDVPKQIRPEGIFDHWVVYNIPPTVTSINENETPGTSGLNGRGEAVYRGPCPPTQYEPTTHRYFFKLYTTDISNLNFIKAPTKADILTAIEGHIIAKAELMGKYDRTKTNQENN